MVSLHPSRISDPAECARLVELAVSEFGRIDVLYNLAAKSHLHWFEGFTDEEWDAARTDEVDLVFYLTRAAWPHLKASRGVVVNMASLNGSLSFKLLPSLAHTTNKAAVIGMTRQLAMEGSEHGIRVNSISPGLIESNATRGQLEDADWAREMRGRTLLGRFGRPGAGSGAVFKGTTGIVLEASPPESRVAMTSALLIALYVGLSVPVIGAGIALSLGASAPSTVLGFAILVGLGVAVSGWALLGRPP